MSHHELNRTIKLIEDADNPLYKWYLQEYDSNGDKVGLEFITQQIGTIRLHIEKLTYIDSFKRSGYDVKSSEFSESEHIYGKLTPNDPYVPSWRQNTFSMFGTDREIKHFGIEIYRTDDGQLGDTRSRLAGKKGLIDSKKEGCNLLGFIGSKEDGDLDIEPHEAEDSLYISVYLNEERFNKIVQHIKDGIRVRHISIEHTDGFYNAWTPSIHLEDIKVLSGNTTFEKDEPYIQQVETTKKCDITPPRVGKVYGFDMVFEIESNILVNDDKENEDEDVYKDDYEIDNPVKLESSTDVISSQLSQISDLGLKLSKFSLDALRLPLWIIAITLLLILIYK
jgi:hypothetical protein